MLQEAKTQASIFSLQLPVLSECGWRTFCLKEDQSLPAGSCQQPCLSLSHPGSEWLSAGMPLLTHTPSNYNQLSNHLFGVRARRLWLSSRVGEKRATRGIGVAFLFFPFPFFPFSLSFPFSRIAAAVMMVAGAPAAMAAERVVKVFDAHPCNSCPVLRWTVTLLGRKTWLARRDLKGVNFRPVNSETCYL